MMAAVGAIAWLLLGTAAAWAHGGHGEAGGPGWTLDPWITVPLFLSAGLYLKGFRALWRRGGTGRKARVRCALFYAAGWLTLAGALVSPLHWLGEHLFSAHMVEHEIVMAISAPLLVLARPGGVLLWAFQPRLRCFLAGFARAGILAAGWATLTRPLVATVLHGVAIWAWHAPPLFEVAVENVAIHRLQHLSFFLTGLLFWWALVRRGSPASAAGHLFVTMTHTGILGALITFAPRVLYQVQTAQAQRWGLTPLQDQQLAGLIMWVPAGTVYAGAAIGFAARWVRRSSEAWKANDALSP
jgi:putative membrane protein